MHTSRPALALIATAALLFPTLAACSSDSEGGSGGDTAGGESYSIGISQLVQHPALDAATEGFKEAFADAGVDVEFTEQNANGEQATALTIAQQFAGQNLDLILANATPAAQAMAQNVTDTPILFTSVTDPVEAELVNDWDAPGANVTGTSDKTPLKDQFDLIEQLAPDTKTIGIVYASGEVNSQIQVKDAEKEAAERGWTVETQTVTSVGEIPQAAETLSGVDVFYVPTDNMVVSGISSLVQVAEQHQIPVIGAEAGTVEGGAAATIGIDYKELGRQTGEMALRILRDGEDPAEMPVETATEFSYVVNEDAAKAQGVEIPEEILKQAETV
ncbi:MULTISPECIES: ABC transporter substrate-binding protein [unclassified Corynebacterium]|uniref:ABC transporter substrate-binding protein n=1 Tax=unclassified Corynebacterium TaxID=2624378 RepID=UPI0008A513C5|nr:MULTISPECIES: ABC transporter substrate-binding protein [unclassified Corynebacterium]OFP36465.1 sugar ABC transporter substrate-binding protein [Corynebacterium sp. HMSC071B10]OHF35959.1 sugar ABC transporter substrate-binding protein [Corynebacterium sp. HMSC074A01]